MSTIDKDPNKKDSTCANALKFVWETRSLPNSEMTMIAASRYTNELYAAGFAPADEGLYKSDWTTEKWVHQKGLNEPYNIAVSDEGIPAIVTFDGEIWYRPKEEWIKLQAICAQAIAFGPIMR
jgi:hypothetical protein